MSDTKNNLSLRGRLAMRVSRPPFWMIGTLLVLTVATWVPLAVIARARFNTMDQPRIHIFQDMGNQPKQREQQASAVFADGRAARPVIEGTVARGQLANDDHYARGFSAILVPAGAWQPTFFTGFPAQLKVDQALLERGRQRFGIYCAPCHGLDGAGAGPIHVRAQEKGETLWIPPTNLTSEPVRLREEGHLYNTINNGIRNMAGYGAQIPVDDRWAIVAYVRALQLSRNAPPALVPAERLNEMK